MIRTARLILRDFTRADFAAVHAWASDPEVVRYMDWGPNTADETRAFLVLKLEEAAVQPRTVLDLAVVPAGGTEPVGSVGLRVAARVGILGYCLARSAWGRGYATEAARGLVDHGFRALGLTVVRALCDRRNAASIRVMEKVGLTGGVRDGEGRLIPELLPDPVMLAIDRERWRRLDRTPSTGKEP